MDWLCPKGFGKLTFIKDPHVYEGELKNGVPNGRGKEYCDGKLVKEGIFEEGMMSDGNRVFYVDSFQNVYLYPATSED